MTYTCPECGRTSTHVSLKELAEKGELPRGTEPMWRAWSKRHPGEDLRAWIMTREKDN